MTQVIHQTAALESVANIAVSESDKVRKNVRVHYIRDIIRMSVEIHMYEMKDVRQQTHVTSNN